MTFSSYRRSYAQKNIEDELALGGLLQEVQDLRRAAQERQEALRPRLEQVHMALQEDPRAPVIEMMQQAAGDAESACREMIDAGANGGTVAHTPFTHNTRRTHAAPCGKRPGRMAMHRLCFMKACLECVLSEVACARVSQIGIRSSWN